MVKFFQSLRLVVFVLLSAFVFGGSPVSADDDSQKATKDAAYHIAVIGDSLASGLYDGLRRNLRDREEAVFHVIGETKVNTGLVRSDRYDWPHQVEKLAQSSDFQVAFLMLGGNDAQSFRMKGRRHHYKTEGWEELYRDRIDRIIKALKKKGIAVYWVGLPNIKNAKRREQFLHVNAIFKERAEKLEVGFIDTWDVTNDEKGRFRPYGKALSGKKALLRSRDGTHFTFAGNRVLARYAEKALQEDLIDKDTSITAGVETKTAP